LEINYQIHAEEEKATALQATLKSKKEKELKKIDISDVEIRSKAAEPKSSYEKKSSQISLMCLLEVTTPLFGGATISLVIAEKSRITLNAADKWLRVCLLTGIQEGGFSGSFQNIRLDNPLAQALLGKKVGDVIPHEGKTFKLVNIGCKASLLMASIGTYGKP
jgi:transcription elongation GreA/GreB family factor